MEARELMIGDWVYDTHSYNYNKGKEPIKLDRNTFAELICGCTGNNDLDLGDMYEPIPLTKEILKANGFWTSNEHWYRKRVRENGVFDVCVSLDYEEIEITKVCGVGTDEEEADYGLSIEIGRGEIFVHKFQHILRIYDLFDLATNFKIE